MVKVLLMLELDDEQDIYLHQVVELSENVLAIKNVALNLSNDSPTIFDTVYVDSKTIHYNVGTNTYECFVGIRRTSKFTLEQTLLKLVARGWYNDDARAAKELVSK